MVTIRRINLGGVEIFDWEIIRNKEGYITKLIAYNKVKSKTIDVVRNDNNKIIKLDVTMNYKVR